MGLTTFYGDRVGEYTGLMLPLFLISLIGREESKAIVKLAVELGCTFIDTCDVSFSRTDELTTVY